MQDEADERSQRIDERLAEMARHITEARDAFATVACHVGRTVEVRLEQAKARAGTGNAQFREERKKVNSKVKRTLTNSKQKLKNWSETGQSQKLQRYAEQTEQYALAALLDANEAVDAALIAAMESLEARLLSRGASQKRRSKSQTTTALPLPLELP